MSLDVVVVVVTYNSADMIGELLASLPLALGDLDARVVIVDNGSTDGTAGLVAAQAWAGVDVEVVRSSNRGYSSAINIGAARAPGAAAVLVLNADVRLFPGSVGAMFDALATPGVGIVAPMIVDPSGARADSLRRVPTLGRASGLSFTRLAWFSEYVTDERRYAVAGPVDWATGAALLVARGTHEELGGWDESFFLYSEETDFCLRAADRGWRTVYEPRAVVEHRGGGSGRSSTTHAMQILNKVRLYARRNGTLRGWAYYLLTVLSESTWVLRGLPSARVSVRALLVPAARPAELKISDGLLPL